MRNEENYLVAVRDHSLYDQLSLRIVSENKKSPVSSWNVIMCFKFNWIIAPVDSFKAITDNFSDETELWICEFI